MKVHILRRFVMAVVIGTLSLVGTSKPTIAQEEQKQQKRDQQEHKQQQQRERVQRQSDQE